jgi:hypothetical protein
MSYLELLSPDVHAKILKYSGYLDPYNIVISKSNKKDSIELIRNLDDRIVNKNIESVQYLNDLGMFIIRGSFGYSFSATTNQIGVGIGHENRFVVTITSKAIQELIDYCVKKCVCGICEKSFEYGINNNQFKLHDCIMIDREKRDYSKVCSSYSLTSLYNKTYEMPCEHIPCMSDLIHTKCMNDFIYICACCDKYTCEDCADICSDCGNIYCKLEKYRGNDDYKACIKKCEWCYNLLCDKSKKITKFIRDNKLEYYCEKCNYTCANCHKNTYDNVELIMFNTRHYCSGMNEKKCEKIYCEPCFDELKNTMNINSWNVICADCDTFNYKECNLCNKNIYSKFLLECKGCFQNFCKPCLVEQPVLTENLRDSNYYCHECDININYYKCDLCDNHKHINDLSKCVDCNNERICLDCIKKSISGDKLCISCAKEYSVIMSLNDLMNRLDKSPNQK